MGVKVKKLNVSLILFIVCTIPSFSQKKNMLEEMKEFALCTCVNKNYNKIDTTFLSNDVTNSYLMQTGILSIKTYEMFTEFIDNNTSKYYKQMPYGSYDNPNANMIFHFCMEFYKSKELDKYARKLLKEKD